MHGKAPIPRGRAAYTARDRVGNLSVSSASTVVVERGFGVASMGHGLARDRAGRLDVSAARLALVNIQLCQ